MTKRRKGPEGQRNNNNAAKKRPAESPAAGGLLSSFRNKLYAAVAGAGLLVGGGYMLLKPAQEEQEEIEWLGEKPLRPQHKLSFDGEYTPEQKAEFSAVFGKVIERIHANPELRSARNDDVKYFVVPSLPAVYERLRREFPDLQAIPFDMLTGVDAYTLFVAARKPNGKLGAQSWMFIPDEVFMDGEDRREARVLAATVHENSHIKHNKEEVAAGRQTSPIAAAEVRAYEESIGSLKQYQQRLQTGTPEDKKFAEEMTRYIGKQDKHLESWKNSLR